MRGVSITSISSRPTVITCRIDVPIPAATAEKEDNIYCDDLRGTPVFGRLEAIYTRTLEIWMAKHVLLDHGLLAHGTIAVKVEMRVLTASVVEAHLSFHTGYMVFSFFSSRRKPSLVTSGAPQPSFSIYSVIQVSIAMYCGNGTVRWQSQGPVSAPFRTNIGNMKRNEQVNRDLWSKNPDALPSQWAPCIEYTCHADDGPTMPWK